LASHAEPERTCIACRRRAPKRSLLRIARGKTGLRVDPSAIEPGRGAYLHREPQCVDVAFQKRRLVRALRASVTKEEDARLREAIEKEIHRT
jgi:predicted RNA-binding protein YlxR (DUF448 family)